MARLLRLGKRGEDVKKLQTDLNKVGAHLKADGIFGVNTLSAVREFQREHDLTMDGIVGSITRLALFNTINADKVTFEVLANKPKTTHFFYEEFVSKCDAAAVANGIPREFWPNLQSLMNNLEIVRSVIGDKPLVVRSGYRSKAYNQAVGGARTSQHIYAKAADIYVAGRIISCKDLARRIYDDPELRVLFGGYGLGSNTNIHLDIRNRWNPEKPAYWWYGAKSWAEWGK